MATGRPYRRVRSWQDPDRDTPGFGVFYFELRRARHFAAVLGLLC
jgi:hypothetical protein